MWRGGRRGGGEGVEWVGKGRNENIAQATVLVGDGTRLQGFPSGKGGRWGDTRPPYPVCGEGEGVGSTRVSSLPTHYKHTSLVYDSYTNV